ncbi:MAG: FMN-binding protein, partial [Chloroflexota bacterium]
TLALVLLLAFRTPDQLGAVSSSRNTALASITAERTVTGPTISTRWGPVQVQLTVANGKITDVTALQLPTGGRSGRISQQCEPTLRSQALAAQSASIDGVSGATYTSIAYARSLQAALDSLGS